MQPQPSNFLNPSQRPFPSTEGDIPFFEDAFDTDSLKKFFQEQDSFVNSPSTILGNSRSFSEPQSSVYQSRSIFGSPLSLYGQSLFENSSINVSPELPKRIPFKSEDLFGKSTDDVRPWTFDEDLSKTERVQKVASMDRKTEDGRMEIVKGINKITINVAGRFPNKDQPSRIGEGFRAGDLESIESGQYEREERKMEVERRESEPLEKTFMRKLVFTIERSVTPKLIEKKEKAKVKAPILAKKNSDADELKVERKNSSKHPEKVQKKESIDILRVERKESVTSTSKKSTKQKSKQKEDFFTS